MSRIRSVHPGLFTDEAFASSSMAAKVLFIGVWTECDDVGVFEWKPLKLKMRIFPGDHVDVGELLAELASKNCVLPFEFDGRKLGAVRNFCKWQRPKFPQILYPMSDEARAFVCMSVAEKEDEEKSERGTALGRILSEAQNAKCFYCESEITFYRKKPHSLEVDHRIPISRGGSDERENLVASCRHCNSLKANMTDVEFRAKFAPSELRSRHASRSPKQLSPPILSPKLLSPPSETLSGDAKSHSQKQREDGGGRMEDNLEAQRMSPASRRSEFDKIEQSCREALGEIAPDDHVIGPMVRLVDQGIALNSMVSVLISEARRKRSKPIRTWKVWAYIVVEKMGENQNIVPKLNGSSPPDTLDPSESTRAADLGRGNILEEKSVVKMIRSTFDAEMPNRAAFYNFLLKEFDSVEKFRERVEAGAPQLMRFWPPDLKLVK